MLQWGPDCYEDKSQKWCDVGDWVLTGKYVGSKLRYDEEDYVIINDDEGNWTCSQIPIKFH